MNTKKLLGYAVAIILLALPIVFSGCKKGPEDPFLSFRSRKARVCGTWTVTNLRSEVVRKQNNVNTKTETTVEGENIFKTICKKAADFAGNFSTEVGVFTGYEMILLF